MTENPVIDLRLVAVTPDQIDLRRRGLPELIEAMAEGGITALMFREKSLPDTEFLELAIRCQEVCRRRGVAFILNERLELASALGFPTVHLTHRSPPVAEARRLAEGSTIGISVHCVEEGVRRAAEGVDYLVFGPVYSTPSKRGIVSAQGTAALRELCARVELPVVAIGGIHEPNAPEIVSSGVAGMAVIRALFDAVDPVDAARKLMMSGRTDS